MVFTAEDRILIKNLYLFKGYNCTRLLAEFPEKNWKKWGLRIRIEWWFAVQSLWRWWRANHEMMMTTMMTCTAASVSLSLSLSLCLDHCLSTRSFIPNVFSSRLLHNNLIIIIIISSSSSSRTSQPLTYLLFSLPPVANHQWCSPVH